MITGLVRDPPYTSWMGVSAAQADAFYREVLDGKSVWTVRDDGGCPAPMGSGGQRAMPFGPSGLARRESSILSRLMLGSTSSRYRSPNGVSAGYRVWTAMGCWSG